VIYLRVQFRHKIKKILSGQALVSARKHTRRILHKPRFPLETERIIETIDRKKFDQIRQRYAVDDPGDDWPKYLDLERWMDINIRRVRELELDLSPPKRILDLGCGTGYFLYICKLLGHDVLGLDLDELPMFAELTNLFGVRRVIFRVQPFTPLPKFGKKFDFITAFLVCFNNHKQPDLWGVPEWKFFLDDLSRHITPRGGCVWLELNREYDGTYYTNELREFFEGRGAKIDNNRIIFRTGLRAPALISLAAP
jgi:SAM-dependent methyltransferase